MVILFKVKSLNKSKFLLSLLLKNTTYHVRLEYILSSLYYSEIGGNQADYFLFLGFINLKILSWNLLIEKISFIVFQLDKSLLFQPEYCFVCFCNFNPIDFL